MTVDSILDTSALDRLRRLGGDALVRQMIELYLAHGPERVFALTKGAAAGDSGQVERAAHTMKSSAGNLGAIRLQRTAEALESSAAAGAVSDEMVACLVREYEESADALRRVAEEDT